LTEIVIIWHLSSVSDQLRIRKRGTNGDQKTASSRALDNLFPLLGTAHAHLTIAPFYSGTGNPSSQVRSSFHWLDLITSVGRVGPAKFVNRGITSLLIQSRNDPKSDPFSTHLPGFVDASLSFSLCPDQSRIPAVNRVFDGPQCRLRRSACIQPF
jgi:hypothetical protein